MRKKITLLISMVLFTYVCCFAQDIVIKGSIKDKNGSPLPGVSVTVKNSKSGASSNGDGEYSISAPGNSTLVFSMIGYKIQEVAVNNRAQLNVELIESVNELSDVVVVGYGTALKKDVTGAISSVKATQLENENPQSVADILKGNIAGLSVGMNTSAKGGGDLLVRGKTTLTASTSPLIVLDGVIYIGQLSDINPNDIETIDVLKDASSLAVYGSKAATGVVAITTKKGKSSTPTINFNTNFGIATLSKDQPVYDGPGFLAWRGDVLRSAGTSPAYIYNDPDNLPAGVTLTQWLNGQTTTNPKDLWLTRLGLLTNEKNNYFAGNTIDWYDLLFRTGQRQDHTLSIAGRKDEVNYYMSLGYLKNENLIEGGQFSTVRTRVNLDAKAAKFLNVGINFQYADRDEGSIEADWSQLTSLSPYGDYYNTDGSLRRIPTDDNGLNARNPFLNPTYNSRMVRLNTLFGSIYAKATLPFGITYQLNFSPGIDMYRTFNASSSLNPNVTTPGGSATRAQETRYNWQVDNLLKWNKTLGKIHNFDATFLVNGEKYQSWYTLSGNEGFIPSDILGYHNLGSGIKASVSSDDQAYKGDALMGRIIYSLLGRYNLSYTLRRDGFSGFGANNKRAVFQSAGAAWTFTEESFLKDIKWLNYGKLRVSYGENGNRVVDQYSSLSAEDLVKYQYVNSSGVPSEVNGLVGGARIGNPELKWEKTKSLNIGLDFGIINNRINGALEFYDKKTSDLLISQTLSNVSGASNVISNIGAVNNKGFEISISSKNITSGKILWNSNFIFSLNRNKIIRLATPNNDPGNGWFIGKDIDVIWDYKILGVWQTNEVAEANKFNKGIKPGDYKLQDVDGNYVYNDADKQFLGYRNPRFTWAFRNELNIYKSFDLSFQLISNWGQKGQDNQGLNQPGSVGFGRTSSYVVPYWTVDNPTNEYARLSSGLSGTSFNVYRKSSFIRLNTVALSYTLPTDLISKVKLQSAKVYFNINNAALYAPDWNTWDPQNNGPTPRYYTLGLNISL
ncbi:SusC/RagA family TonB-linked outer membrane protein [Pedobacter boryungensis]|uniref:SusC/RagA family TonB-linked outer membrane protein n=1 Tax=Pedobacter boryungensis TaxID=869962 RepID=A0ABX2DEW6_9SPHI|nr:SusC/RagA family TonB-linked outer membrane protein [Pedobacter boryungensis]NQX32638.1 SusC/RagA family TonB-linked outer membrane protein [Pedobacter boryungensis]